MSDPRLLTEDGKAILEKMLSEADSPLSVISSIQKTKTIDRSDLEILYQFCDATNVKPNDIMDPFLKHQIDYLSKQVDKMNGAELTSLLADLSQYAEVKDFESLIKLIISKLGKIPKTISLPSRYEVTLSPSSQSALYVEQPALFQSLLSEIFASSFTNFDESDDFSFSETFERLSQVIFYRKALYDLTVEHIEAEFQKTYRSVYSVIRVKIALSNSPFSLVDPVRPLCLLITRSIGKPELEGEKFKKAWRICGPSTAMVVMSLPQFMIAGNATLYGEGLGIRSEDFNTWRLLMRKDSEESQALLLANQLFARFVAINLVQGKAVNLGLALVLGRTKPQCDIGFILCRKFCERMEPIVREWSQYDPCVFIDYATRLVANGKSIENLVVPELSQRQAEVLNQMKSA